MRCCLLAIEEEKLGETGGADIDVAVIPAGWTASDGLHGGVP